MVQEYYSHGKLLLTGEYAILDGAIGLAVPTQFGQSLSVRESRTGEIHWCSLDERNAAWFTAQITLGSFKLLQTTDVVSANRLVDLFKAANSLNPSFFHECHGAEMETKLTFPRDWGLGSSSTLITNMAHWAQVDPYVLLKKTFGGSGYDIACAQNNGPIIYANEGATPTVERVQFNPSFKEELFFVHLNKKQNSRDAITAYRELSLDKKALITAVDELTESMVRCTDLMDFQEIMVAHEALISKTLGIPTIKQQQFRDYPKAIKSLGAWGGDFIMVTGGMEEMKYFSQKGYTTLLPYAKMVL